MFQKDYVLRMIEMMGDLVAAIIGMIRKGDFKKATSSIDNAYHNFLKQDASLLQRIPKEELTDTLLQEHNYTNGHLEILAELFYVEAELLYAQGNFKRSLEFYEKVLIIMEFGIKESKTFSLEKQTRISNIKAQIEKIRKEGS